MGEKESCEFLIKILNTNKFELTLKDANSLMSSYKWLFEYHAELSKPKPKPKMVKKAKK